MAEYYKLREDLSIEFFGHKLFRIECIKELRDVKVGDLGGYIEKEKKQLQDEMKKIDKCTTKKKKSLWKKSNFMKKT